jgi:hypothetical protein
MFYIKKLNITRTKISCMNTCGYEGYLKSFSKEILFTK